MPQLFQIAAIAIATFGTGAATLTVMNEDIPDLEVPTGAWAADGMLDGATFKISGSDVNSGAELEDVIRFRDGKFQSADCQKYCDFGWTEYQTKVVDGVTHFTTVTTCPDAPHTVVWYGTVKDDKVNLEVTWTTRRWYWTNQIHVRGSGAITETQDLSG